MMNIIPCIFLQTWARIASAPTLLPLVWRFMSVCRLAPIRWQRLAYPLFPCWCCVEPSKIGFVQVGRLGCHLHLHHPRVPHQLRRCWLLQYPAATAGRNGHHEWCTKDRLGAWMGLETFTIQATHHLNVIVYDTSMNDPSWIFGPYTWVSARCQFLARWWHSCCAPPNTAKRKQNFFRKIASSWAVQSPDSGWSMMKPKDSAISHWRADLPATFRLVSCKGKGS